jgi:hypothetical protein
MIHLSKRLLLSAAAALAFACGPTGPDTLTGLTTCDQLRECACDPARAFDPDACNQMVDALEQSTDPTRACTQRLQTSGCGRPLQVNPGGL